jgi:exopolyphosphatase/guanosine-5'-triphosphate,3'-diphosphate pyrophosphatase
MKEGCENTGERVAAIDIGSNAIRLVLANKKESGEFKKCKKWRVPLRLGAEAFSIGSFSKTTSKKFLDVFEEFNDILSEYQIEQTIAHATSAFRDSSNSVDLIRSVKKNFGIHIKVIDGAKEAELIYQAVSKRYIDNNHPILVADLGGGSLELIYGEQGRLKACKSFQMGTVRLLGERNRELALKQLSESIEEWLHAEVDDFEHLGLIGTGGNLRRMGKLCKKVYELDKSEVVELSQLNAIQNVLSDMSISERVRVFGMTPDRAEVVTPAIEIIKLLLDISAKNSIRVPKVGLVDGMLMSIQSNKMTFSR